MENDPSGQNTHNTDPAIQGPETDRSAEVGEAMSAISGLGATAASGVEMTVASEPAGPGFLKRRWNGIKSGFKNALSDMNQRNSAAGKAIAEAGGSLSKWDVAKANMRAAVNAVPLTANMMAYSFSEVMLRPAGNGNPHSKFTQIAENARHRYNKNADNVNAGTNNPVLRRRMAETLVDGHDNAHPVIKHLTEHGKQPWRSETMRAAVNEARDRKENPAYYQFRQAIGGMVLGFAVPTLAYLAAKGHVPAEAASTLKEISGK